MSHIQIVVLITPSSLGRGSAIIKDRRNPSNLPPLCPHTFPKRTHLR